MRMEAISLGFGFIIIPGEHGLPRGREGRAVLCCVSRHMEEELCCRLRGANSPCPGTWESGAGNGA